MREIAPPKICGRNGRTKKMKQQRPPSKTHKSYNTERGSGAGGKETQATPPRQRAFGSKTACASLDQIPVTAVNTRPAGLTTRRQNRNRFRVISGYDGVHNDAALFLSKKSKKKKDVSGARSEEGRAPTVSSAPHWPAAALRHRSRQHGVVKQYGRHCLQVLLVRTCPHFGAFLTRHASDARERY